MHFGLKRAFSPCWESYFSGQSALFELLPRYMHFYLVEYTLRRIESRRAEWEQSFAPLPTQLVKKYFLFCDLIWINFSTTNNFCYKFIKKLRSFSQKWSKSEQISAILVQIQSILVQIALCIVVLCRHIEEFTGSRNFFHFFEPLLVQKCHFPSQNPVHIGI